MDMPNSYRARERHIRTKHPEWFSDEDAEDQAGSNKDEQAAPQTERESEVPRSGWRWIGYGWTVLWNLVVLALVFLVFAGVNDPNTRRVLGTLGLLYGTLVTAGWWSGYLHTEQARLVVANLSQIRRLLKDKGAEDLDFQVAEAVRMGRTRESKAYINLCFVWLVYMWCAFVVLTA